MSDLKESVVESIKNLILPEIRKLQEGQNEIRIRQEALEKMLAVMNENILGNSRRIDETNKRIDLVYIEMGNIKMEMERIKRGEAVTADILHRMEVLEEKVLLGR